jgi:hypothetical protein
MKENTMKENTMNRKTAHALALALVAALAALALGTAANAAIIDNPNFDNGDFEDGGTGWTVTDNKGTGVDFDPGVAQSGSKSARFLGDFTNNGPTITQTVTIPNDGIGQLHTISFWYRQFGTDITSWTRWRLRVLDGGTTELVNSGDQNTVGNLGVWEQESYTFTPSASTIEIEFKDRQQFPGTNRDLVVDNVQLTYNPIPEPATLALLGLGGALMLGRRRRA